MNPVISVRNISKQYILGAQRSRHQTFREMIATKAGGMLEFFSDSRRQEAGKFWALKDISFEVNKGEIVGIIGRNGSGKSTLLKILSRITEPTTGRVVMQGKTASLLEVGTGFHPELTGRENIYLNGAILGMNRNDINKRLDEIVAFSEIERFIDMPVKRYSSGMSVRLAFAVAAHIVAEILLIDEVLAVGDIVFQKKCLGKMNDIAKDGRTVLFVSHDMSAIKRLCEQSILIREGSICLKGETETVIEKYVDLFSKSIGGDIPEGSSSLTTGEAKFKRVRLIDRNGAAINNIFYTDPLRICLLMDVFKEIKDALVDIKIISSSGLVIIHSVNTLDGSEPFQLKKGSYEIKADIENYLEPGNYSITLGVHYSSGITIDCVECIYDFSVLDHSSTDQSIRRYPWLHGLVRVVSRWSLKTCSR